MRVGFNFKIVIYDLIETKKKKHVEINYGIQYRLNHRRSCAAYPDLFHKMFKDFLQSIRLNFIYNALLDTTFHSIDLALFNTEEKIVARSGRPINVNISENCIPRKMLTYKSMVSLVVLHVIPSCWNHIFLMSIPYNFIDLTKTLISCNDIIFHKLFKVSVKYYSIMVIRF